MPIIQRRVFYGKVGAAEELVAWARGMYEIIGEYGGDLPYRILTDDQSGRTDRVVVEVEVESLGQLEAVLGRVGSDPGGQARFAEVFNRLPHLIDHAEVEQWAIR